MNNFRIIVVIAGILIAGLAANTTLAQSPDANNFESERHAAHQEHIKNKQAIHATKSAKADNKELKQQSKATKQLAEHHMKMGKDEAKVVKAQKYELKGVRRSQKQVTKQHKIDKRKEAKSKTEKKQF
jgi:hypothetical protein